MSIKLSAALILVLIAYAAGVWSASNWREVAKWGKGIGDSIVRKVDNVPSCPDGYSCIKKP